jgi:hypothetical protein
VAFLSYEYSSSSQNFTFPNPLREHNMFVGAAAAVSGLTGFLLLFQARAALRSGAHIQALAASAVAFALIMVGGYLLFQLFSQLRFFFGRGRPQGLAPQLAPDQTGTSTAAEAVIKESLRQQALEYPEPGDPLSSLLYSLVPDLIYAPRPVRAFAERQFQAGILTVALLAGLLVSAILGGGEGGRVSGWVAIILFVISAPSLLNPKSGANTDLGISVLSVPKMAALIAFSVLGPVAIALVGNALPNPPFGIGATTLLLLLALAGVLYGLFFTAVVRHRMAAPSTTVSMIQDTWNISVNPAMLSAEFMRAMQDGWWEKIPNRRYCRIDPLVNLADRTGEFHGSIVEETQPVPFVIDGARIDGQGSDQPFASGNPMIITLINGYALLLTVVASVASFLLVGALTGGGTGVGSLAACTLFVWALAKAAFTVARFLRLRFDFRSHVIWMEMNGTYAAAEVAQGNRYTSNLHSSSQVVQIEGMTFRLWVAEVHSAAFGKDGARYILAMLGKPAMAAALAKRLKDFITSQATLVSIGSSGDQDRAQRSAMMNAQLNLGNGTLPFDRLPFDRLPTRPDQE